MKWQLELSRLEEARSFIYALACLSAALLLLSVCLAIAVLRRDETWILVPQHTPDAPLTVRRSGWTPSYLMAWADGVVSSALTLSPETVERRHKDLLKISQAGAVDLRKFLAEEAGRIQKNRMETVFYPKEFRVDPSQQEIHVSGEMLVYLGHDKAPISREKSFCVSYVKSPVGALLLSGLREIPRS